MESQRHTFRKKEMTAWKVLRETEEGQANGWSWLTAVSGMNQLEDGELTWVSCSQRDWKLVGFSFLLLPPVLTTCCPTKGETRCETSSPTAPLASLQAETGKKLLA